MNLIVLRRITALSCLMMLFCAAAQAKTEVQWIHVNNATECYNGIIVTRDDGCMMLIRHDCDNDDPCGWTDGGWICKPQTLIIPTGGIVGSSELAEFDSFGNLFFSVAPGTGGTYSPSTLGGNVVCFTSNSSSTQVVAAAFFTDIH